MTEQELREKIVNVLSKMQNFGERLEQISQTGPLKIAKIIVSNEKLADALIATGIGDVKEVKFESDHYWHLWQGALVEVARAERRAKVAERALQIADELGELCGRKEDYVQQAEKELAEGAK